MPDDVDSLSFKPIALSKTAPRSNGGLRELRSLTSAVEYVKKDVPASKGSELAWQLACAALDHAHKTGECFPQARAALVEALTCEGWLGE